MRKTTFTLLLSVLLSMVELKVFAYDAEIGGIYYYFKGTEATVTYQFNHNNKIFSYYLGDIVIPSSVEYNGQTYTVTSIGDWAFHGCTGLTSITIPNSVTSIGEYAFQDCTGLSSITIPNSVTSIGYRAFRSCSGLSSVTISNSLTGIVNEIFSGCSGLTSVTIPESVTSIGNAAFSGCAGLTSITIPESVTSIGVSSFGNCSGITAIKVESGNTVYDSRDNCNAIIETNSNTLIAGCKNTLIPQSVTSIGFSAFVQCSGLTSITIPNSVTSIGDYAFYNCSGLTSIIIPNSVTSIGNSAFSWCSGLTSITIPNSVTRINNEAFHYCSVLSSVKVYWNTPLLISLVVYSNSNYHNATLYVPTGTKAVYEVANVWKDFKNIVEFDAEAEGIEAVMSGREGIKSIYNLSGKRLSKPQRGLNIIDSRKLIVK